MNQSGADDPRDDAIDGAYRATPRDAPPRALDGRILAAAHRAVAARPAPARPDWTRRWRVPLSVAATVILSATITLMMYESDDAPPPLAPARPQGIGDAQREQPRADMKAPGRLGEARRDAERKAGPEAERQTAPQRSEGLAGEAAAPRAGAPSESPPEPFPADDRARRSAPIQAERDQAAPLAKESAPASPPASSSAAPGAAPGKAEAEPATTARARAREPTANEDRALADRPAGRAAGAAPAPPRAPAPAIGAASAMKPAPGTRRDWTPPSGRGLPLVTAEDWVAEIRWLKREGRDAEAALWLAELRTRFPEFALPEDLR